MTWQGIPQPDSRNNGITATFTLCVSGAPDSYSVATDASGYFTATTGLPNGTYNWWIKRIINLANSGTLTIAHYQRAPGSAANLEMGTLRAGDCNNSNDVSAVDFTMLKATFGKSSGQPGYDDRADFTGDQVVNIQDFNLLKINFGTAGAPPIDPGGR